VAPVRTGLRCGLLLAAWLLVAAVVDAAPAPQQLRFERPGAAPRVLSLGALRAACPLERVEVDDPYYEQRMRWLALPLACVLERGFAQPLAKLRAADFSLRALDGYARPATGAQLLAPGGHLAFADARLSRADARPFVPGWEPIGRRRLDPGPFYLVWSGPGQNDPHRHPWPYQLATIEQVPFEARHPHTLPRGAAPGSPAQRGFALFRSQCIMCHAINGEGGRVGPDLNVPMSIVEYRPEAQIKAFVRDPQRFRYTSMPAHRDLSEAQLDALIAYFRAMSALKYDARAADPQPDLQ